MKREILAKIFQFFKTQKGVVAVYLYGSQAKKTAIKKSDLDLTVLFNKPLKRPTKILELGVKLQKLLGNKIRIDLREINLSLSPVFLGEVISTGQIIFCSNEEARIAFEVSAMRIIDDAEEIRKINLFYLQKSLQEGTYGTV